MSFRWNPKDTFIKSNLEVLLLSACMLDALMECSVKVFSFHAKGVIEVLPGNADNVVRLFFSDGFARETLCRCDHLDVLL